VPHKGGGIIWRFGFGASPRLSEFTLMSLLRRHRLEFAGPL